MQKWTDSLPESARTYIEGHRLSEVECVVADLAGVARGKAMPASKFATQSHFHLPDSIFLQTITGEWVQTDEGGTEPDMVLKPDLSTATAAPWAFDRTLQVIHDIENQNGIPVSVAPRNVLKRVVNLYLERNWIPVVAPEMEFFLVSRNTDPGQPIEPPVGRSGRRVAARQAYSIGAVDEFGPVIDDIYEFSEAQGFEIDGILQEGGAGQIEINLRHGDPVRLADEIFYFKRLIREAAHRHDCFATFMAKPIQDEPGSAMHIHHSVLDANTGQNIFSDQTGSSTPAFLNFISGLQSHLPSVIAVLAPYVNSYRRYVPGHSAPINLEWGIDNRTTGIRVPVSTPKSRRVENRLAGMDCNPYLGIAASLGCGYLGLVDGTDPRQAFVGNAHSEDPEIPQHLSESLELFRGNKAIQDVLGPEFCGTYAAVKDCEYLGFLQVISPWEREHLLLNV